MLVLTPIIKNSLFKRNLCKTAAMVAVLSFLSVANTTAMAGTSTPSPGSTLKFALADKHGFPNKFIDEEFDCSDKIYAVSELSALEQGKHQVEFRWVDPDGNTRERTQYDFFPDKDANAKLWAWLELTPAKGAIFVRWMNSAAGMEEFIGSWKLELYVDQKRINSGEFKVTC